jgi:hypothetical protein
MSFTRKTVTFGFDGAYWSLPVERFDELMKAIERDAPFDLLAMGARQLKARPAVLDYKRITEARHAASR